MIFEPFKNFAATAFQIKYATEPWERRGAGALRRAVFCDEQQIFSGDDRDAIDDVATPIVALSMLGVAADAVVGVVRIHETAPGLWQGSRLAVAADYRKVGALGAALIKLAVASAHGRGATRFIAQVQSQNALLFRRMHWRTLDEIELHGRAHHLMEADLSFYPPFGAPEQGFIALRRAA
ncbi:GCN5-related N-acetyltransferase [Methylocella silvestris BL2]|uniref:GCN5-related N-acetyltransferase n=1 Tax=Methylocella silvestris (strain DSM 15510 / CIP 108128 / LMG 27833 / NCIMB 13906 / BL2) TaxID=395965 RepID=B8EPT2_METSB|nr:MSMEG_0567/Sll0786 family nitrogen starvation N-acetyltransferase [Methylocella silvestris]ACK50936.1 GCN5-related N-acetyltransferase [Methylocella silvestris BL2]